MSPKKRNSSVRKNEAQPKFEDFESASSAFCAFLRGFTLEVNGIPHGNFIDYNSDNGREYRMRLAAALRDPTWPLGREVRNCLADLFDPDPEWQSNCREFKIVFRKKGNYRDHYARSAIASAVMAEVNKGLGVNAAIAQVAEVHGLDDTTVMKIWSAYKVFREAGML